MRVRRSAVFGRLLTVAALVTAVTAVSVAVPSSSGAQLAETCTISISPTTIGPGESTTFTVTVSNWVSEASYRYLWNGVATSAWKNNGVTLMSSSDPLSYDQAITTLSNDGIDGSVGGVMTFQYSNDPPDTAVASCTADLTLGSSKGGGGGGGGDDDDDDDKKPVTTTTTTTAATVAPATAPEAVPVAPRVTG